MVVTSIWLPAIFDLIYSIAVDMVLYLMFRMRIIPHHDAQYRRHGNAWIMHMVQVGVQSIDQLMEYIVQMMYLLLLSDPYDLMLMFEYRVMLTNILHH
jgi:hypothetical protein